MHKYILLLRGINVGGKNTVSMKVLKALLEENGFLDVTTYINSGNVIFSSESTDYEFLKKKIEALILVSFNLELSVAIVSAKALSEALDHAPDWWDIDPTAKNNAIFVIPPTTVEQVLKQVGESKPEYEKTGYYENVIFWTAPLETFSKTRWSKVVKSSVYDQITIRNSNTVKKLVEIAWR